MVGPRFSGKEKPTNFVNDEYRERCSEDPHTKNVAKETQEKKGKPFNGGTTS